MYIPPAAAFPPRQATNLLIPYARSTSSYPGCCSEPFLSLSPSVTRRLTAIPCPKANLSAADSSVDEPPPPLQPFDGPALNVVGDVFELLLAQKLLAFEFVFARGFSSAPAPALFEVEQLDEASDSEVVFVRGSAQSASKPHGRCGRKADLMAKVSVSYTTTGPEYSLKFNFSTKTSWRQPDASHGYTPCPRRLLSAPPPSARTASLLPLSMVARSWLIRRHDLESYPTSVAERNAAPRCSSGDEARSSAAQCS
mmetsp:Transcript_25277/g.63634  ORF Transcript_25277/g.63634 Transcript_25277/m.63634 type:complete len:254 (-) Transcript_25277:744-1505(-)